MANLSSNTKESVSCRELITLQDAIHKPEAGHLAQMDVSQITDADIRPLAMALLLQDIGIQGVNYGTKKEKIAAIVRDGTDEEKN